VAEGSRAPGLREVLLVTAVVVAVVLGVAFVSGLLPTPIRSLIVDTPLAIIVLIGGTALVLWRISRRSNG
jgi:uncharacterized membrane-anchored protein